MEKNNCPICTSLLKIDYHNGDPTNSDNFTPGKAYQQQSCWKPDHFYQEHYFKSKILGPIQILALSPKRQGYLIINFNKNISTLHLSKDVEISIPKILELDFPSLIKLKEKMKFYSIYL